MILAYLDFIYAVAGWKKINPLIQRQRLCIVMEISHVPRGQCNEGQMVSTQSENHKMWELWPYTWLLPILLSREKETLSSPWNVSALWRRKGERSLSSPPPPTPHAVSRMRELSKLYYPGMSLYTNTFNLPVNAFIQKTWAIPKYEVFIENYLPKANGMFSNHS